MIKVSIVFYLLVAIAPWPDYTDAGLPLRVAWLTILVLWVLGTAACLHYFVEELARKFALAWWTRRHGGGVKGV